MSTSRTTSCARVDRARASWAVAVGVVASLCMPVRAEAPSRDAPPAVGALPRFDIAPPRELTLKNGLRVWFVERRRAPLIDVVAVVDASFTVDPPALPGLASFTAGMLTQGAGELDAIAYSNACDALGAEVGSFVDDDAAGLALHVESSRFEQALGLFALALTRPRFTEEDWQRVRAQTAGDLLVQAQEPQTLARLAALRTAWGADHRYGHNPDGTPSALIATTTADLRSFHAARYRPDTTTLVVVGDIDRTTLVRQLERALGVWTASGPRPGRVALPPPIGRQGRQLVTVHVPDAVQTVLRVVQVAPPDLMPWTPELEVMNTLLGGSFTSRLNHNLREQHGYAYGAGSGFDLRPNGNIFSVRTSVATAVTGPATQEILGELERMQTPASEDEVARARGIAALTLPGQFDNGRNVAMLWATIAARGLERARLTRFMADAARVGVTEVHAIAQRTLAPGDVAVVAVGDMDAVGAALDAALEDTPGAATDAATQAAPDRPGRRRALTPAELLPGLPELARLAAEQTAR